MTEFTLTRHGIRDFLGLSLLIFLSPLICRTLAGMWRGAIRG